LWLAGFGRGKRHDAAHPGPHNNRTLAPAERLRQKIVNIGQHAAQAGAETLA